MDMSAEKLEVDLSHEMRLRCTVYNEPVQEMESSEFQFQGAAWKLEYLKDDRDCDLHLCLCSGLSTDSFHVSVHAERCEGGRMVNVLSSANRFTTEFEEREWQHIWGCTEEGILEAVPEFRLHGILKLIVVLKAGSWPCTKTFTDASVQTKLDACSISSLDTLSEDISGLQDSDLNPDVELRCEGLTARAHRALLSVRSPVLGKMLQADMEEGRTGIVHMRGMDADTFELFLNHLHTGKLEQESLSSGAALRLYQAGKLYQVDSMSAICSLILVQNLTAANAYDVLITADAHDDSYLVEAATRYMLENKIPQPGDERWEAFCSSHQNLAMKVANRYIKELNDFSAPLRKKHCAN